MGCFVIYLFLLVISCRPAISADWPRFRGPNGSGVSDAAGLPVEFGLNKNVEWKVMLPPGHSSPIVAGAHIFLTAHDEDNLFTICIGRKSGKILWQARITRSRVGRLNELNNVASPSPATDGENVYVFFQDYGLISYSGEGHERWRLPLGPFRNGNGMAASPVVSHGLVLLICDQEIGSFVIAVDKDSGKMRWQRDRSNTVGAGYSTPVVYEGAQSGPQLIVPGAFQMIAYTLDKGERIWWINGFPIQPDASPIVGEEGLFKDTLFVNVQGVLEMVVETSFSQLLASLDKNKNGEISSEEAKDKDDQLNGPGFEQADLDGNGILTEKEWSVLSDAMKVKDLLLAVRPENDKGDLSQKVLWRNRKGLPRVPSPILYNDVLYLLKEGGILTALNPETGEALKQARLQGALDTYYASPVAADGKLYLTSQTGHVAVVKAGRDWEILAVNDLGDECFATPAIADGKLYLRTRNTLYCFSKSAVAGN